MGGQACVLYGAAEFSRDLDLALLVEEANLEWFRELLAELQAERVAVPPSIRSICCEVTPSTSATSPSATPHRRRPSTASRCGEQSVPVRNELPCRGRRFFAGHDRRIAPSDWPAVQRGKDEARTAHPVVPTLNRSFTAHSV